MTRVQNNISLLNYNTFGINVVANKFFEYKQSDDIAYLLKQGILDKQKPLLILGGGSNQLFTNNYDGLIIHPVNNKIELIEENNDFILVKADAGIEWDTFVAHTVDKDWGGLENLSNIPGNVGASPVQNIGAYGVEAKDCIEKVHIVSLFDGSSRELSNAECKFGYRDSIFKKELRNKVLVDSVVFKLSKKPQFKLHYGSVNEELKKLGEISLQTIRSTIINIRASKLPDHKETGNVGSFFKNPIVNEDIALELSVKNETMPQYNVGKNRVKLAAGWLIEQCGLKGFTNNKGTAGVHDKQALVIVNKGGASGKDIVEIAEFIQENVYKKFNIKLEPEVIIHD